jgi:hypothetical protein
MNPVPRLESRIDFSMKKASSKGGMSGWLLMQKKIRETGTR